VACVTLVILVEIDEIAAAKNEMRSNIRD